MRQFLLVLFFSFCAVNLFPASYGVILADKVNIRQKPSLASAVAGNIEQNLTLVEVTGKSAAKTKLTLFAKNFNTYWYKISYQNISGYLYGVFLKPFKSKKNAQAFIDLNKTYRNQLQGKYNLKTHCDADPEGGECTLELLKDGRLTYQMGEVAGDHITMGKGEGKYFVTKTKNGLKVVLFIIIGTTWGPDGISPAEYYKLAHGKAPTAAQLKAYIKEMQTPNTSRKDFTLLLSQFNPDKKEIK